MELTPLSLGSPSMGSRWRRRLPAMALASWLGLTVAAQVGAVEPEVIKDLPFKYANSYLEPLSRPVQAGDDRIFIATERALDIQCGELLAITPSTGVTARVKLSRGNQGCGVVAQLVVDVDGTVWGTTNNGAAGKLGSLFRVPAGGNAVTVQAFTPDQGSAAGTLLAWPDGSLRLARSEAPVWGSQRIERLAPARYSPKLIHRFPDSQGLSFPGQLARLGSDELLYGTAWNNASQRVLFSLDAAGVLTVRGNIGLHRPVGDLVDSGQGFFYIATEEPETPGKLLKLYPDGTTELLHAFTGPDGRIPSEPPVVATDGWLYGTTIKGGLTDNGVIYRIRPNGTDYQVLFHFDGLALGGYPIGGLLQARDGKLYGRTLSGGYNTVGIVYRLTPP